jgi:uncharacterized protein involved in outer membrane biogenesis
VKKYRRIFLWAAGGLGITLLALVFILTVVAPGIIGNGSTKARIRDEFAKTAGGTLDFDRLGISLFPRPGVVVYGATLAIPKAGRGAVASVKVCPQLLPLLRGKVRIGKVRIEQPVFRIDLAELPPLGNRTDSSPPPSLEKMAASLFETLAAKVPNLDLAINQGGLELVEKGGRCSTSGISMCAWSFRRRGRRFKSPAVRISGKASPSRAAWTHGT